MRLTIIGCGTAAPDPDRVASGYLIETDDVRVLLDCGPGVVHGLARAGVNWSAIDILALTHFHNDHIGDVPALFVAWKYGMRPRRKGPLEVLGPSGLSALLTALPDALGADVRDPGFDVTLRELRGGEVLRFADTTVRPLPNRHTASSLAYRIDHGGRSFGYTGDTGPDDELADRMRGLDVLVCECSVPDDEEMPGHLTPASAGRFARIADPRRLVLTHAYPQLDRTALPARIAEHWDGPVTVASDGLRIEL